MTPDEFKKRIRYTVEAEISKPEYWPLFDRIVQGCGAVAKQGGDYMGLFDKELLNLIHDAVIGVGNAFEAVMQKRIIRRRNTADGRPQRW